MRCSELLRAVTPAAPAAFAPSHLSAAGAPALRSRWAWGSATQHTMHIPSDFFEMRFGEIRQRYTGKMPFGVLDELGELHDGLPTSDRHLFWSALDSRRHDQFWGWYVGEFVRHRPRPA